MGPLASPRTKVPATPLGLGAAPRGSARGPYLSWNGRRGLCSAALAGKGLQAGCAWPGPRGSLHSLADDRRPLLAPAGSAFYAGAPEAGACTGQAGRPDTTAGPQSPRAPEPQARGLSPGAAAPSTAGESLIKASGGAGPEGRGAGWPRPSRPCPPGQDAPRSAPAALRARWPRPHVWALGPPNRFASDSSGPGRRPRRPRAAPRRCRSAERDRVCREAAWSVPHRRASLLLRPEVNAPRPPACSGPAPGRPATHRADLEAPCVAGPRGGSPVTVHGPGSRSLLPGARAQAGRLGCPRGAPALSRYLHITFVLAPSPCEELAAVPCARGAAGSVAGAAPRGGFEAGPGAPGPRAPGLEAPARCRAPRLGGQVPVRARGFLASY